MLEIKAKLKIPRAAYNVAVKDRLALPADVRAKGTGRARLESGEEVALNLPRGEALRGGDLVTASDGRVVEIVALPEKLLQLEAPELAKLAWHLGSLHVPVQVGKDSLRVAADPAVEEMAKKLGAKVSMLESPFEPEPPAAAAGHGHEGHVHDEHCGHDHHGHAHQHHQYESH